MQPEIVAEAPPPLQFVIMGLSPRMSPFGSCNAASIGFGQLQLWAVHAGVARSTERASCDRSNGGNEPKSTDAALFTNDLFGLDKPRNRSGKTVLFPLDKTYQSNKGIVRCCF